MIAAIADQSTGVKWRGTNNKVTLARGSGIGAGERNTAIIMAVQASDEDNSFAAWVAAYYRVLEDGVTACTETAIFPALPPAETCIADWYLPSLVELNLLYLQKTVVGGFADVNYWSSNEETSAIAHVLSFNNGMQNIDLKSSSLRVRAIRAF